MKCPPPRPRRTKGCDKLAGLRGPLPCSIPKYSKNSSSRLSALIAASPAAEISEKNARALLSGFELCPDLVSREGSDIQAQVLQRTREE